MLIPFAGKDKGEFPLRRADAGVSRWVGRDHRPEKILRLFRSGLDTLDIAKRLAVPEHVVWSELHDARNAERDDR